MSFTCTSCSTVGSGKFCESCGTPAPVDIPVKKFCANCGTSVSEGQRFCQGCGNPTSTNTAPTAQAAYTQQIPPPPPPIPQQVPPYYQSQPSNQFGFTPHNPQSSNSSPMSIGAIVCGVIALLFFPIVLGPLAIILGAGGWSRGEKLGPVAVAVGVIGMIVGMIIGAMVWSSY